MQCWELNQGLLVYQTSTLLTQSHLWLYSFFFFLILERVSLCYPDCLGLTIFLPQPPEQWGLQAGTTRPIWKPECLILRTRFDRDPCCQVAFLAPTRAEWFKGKVFQVTLIAEAPVSTLMPDAVNTCMLEWVPPTMISLEGILSPPTVPSDHSNSSEKEAAPICNLLHFLPLYSPPRSCRAHTKFTCFKSMASSCTLRS